MLCAACHHPNNDRAKFCEQCGQPLELRCPACASPVRPGARFCSQCGHNLTPQSDRSQIPAGQSSSPGHLLSLDERLDHLQRYLPQHLTDKILAHRGRLQGERKLVTVLFADLVNYTALSAQLGEEALFALMDDLYERLIHEIHRYEGTVNELTGDGLVAFFGAPLAVEQAPQRAVRAALALQEAVVQLSTKMKQARGVPLQLRVGINTGPVIVGTIGNNLRMDYKAVGHTVNLAARMEQTAAPGTIQLTEHTYKLVAGYFECDDLGLMSVKGLAEQVQVYRVRGEREVRARIEVARERGFTRLVGREHELALLRQCFDLTKGGRGQAVSLIGEAGLGKSRLLHEFRQALAHHDCVWPEGRCQPYGMALAYGPVIEVLKQFFQIAASDSGEDIRGKVRRGLEPLGTALAAAAPYMCHLLGVETEGVPAGLTPEAVKHRTFAALRGLLCESAARHPLVLTIEDLHWADPTTVEFLTFLLEHIAGARVLLLCTYRPEFVCPWSRKSYHRVITLTPLAHPDGSQMLTALLDAPQIQDDLVTLVLDKTEGVPFFIEELVQSLRETAAIELHDGQWRLAASATVVPVPDTVEEVLTARIDRLPEGAKSVLQIGAVIGREWSEELVREVAELAEPELTAHLAALTEAELLYARGLPPQTMYVFKHAFTQEAAYRSLLTTRRQELHHRVAVTLEALFPDRLEEHCGPLAHHYCEAAHRGDEAAKAVAYAMRAGARNMALPAYAEAIRFYRMALQALDHQDLVDEAQRCALLLALGEAQRNAGELLAAQETFLRAADIARALGATELLVRAALGFERMTWQAALPTGPAVRLLEEALERLGSEDSPLTAKTLGGLAEILRFTGARQQALVYAQQAVAMARRFADPELLADNLQGLIYALQEPEHAQQRLTYASEMLQLAEAANAKERMCDAHFWRVLCLLELGDMPATDAAIDAYDRVAEERQLPFELFVTMGFRATRALMQGRFADCERLTQEALAMGQRLQMENAAGIFGLQMFTLRCEQGRLKELEPVVRYFVQQHSVTAAWRPGLALIYSELGRTEEARAEFEHLAQHDFADLARDALWMVCMTYLVDVCTFLGDKAHAATLYQLLLPYARRTVVVGNAVACYGAVSRYLGALTTTLGRWDEAERHFEDALAMNARMEAWPWLAHTQYQYATMLLTRDQPGDREKVRELLKAALLTARELGMRALEERLIAPEVMT